MQSAYWLVLFRHLVGCWIMLSELFLSFFLLHDTEQMGFRFMYNIDEFPLCSSDDRSVEVFRNKIESSTQMKSVLGVGERPNCLVIDEIDGAPTVGKTSNRTKMGNAKTKFCLICRILGVRYLQQAESVLRGAWCPSLRRISARCVDFEKILIGRCLPQAYFLKSKVSQNITHCSPFFFIPQPAINVLLSIVKHKESGLWSGKHRQTFYKWAGNFLA